MKSFFYSIIFIFSFLTILPFPKSFFKESSFQESLMEKFDERATKMSAVFFPLIGLIFGLIIFIFANLFQKIHLPIEVIASIILALPYIFNKFLHLDGLCDFLDAFLLPRSKEERLRILKDSNIGSFAMGGVTLILIFKYTLIKALISESHLIPHLIIIPVLSRYSMVYLSFRSRYPREKGMGQFIIGNISGTIFFMSTAISIVLLIGFSFIFEKKGIHDILMIFSSLGGVILFSTLMKIYSYKKIGGITGDVLGALNEVIEVVLLVILLSLGLYL